MLNSKMCNSIFTRINMITVQIFVYFAIFGCIVYADVPYKPCYPDDPIYKSIEILKWQCNSTPCVFERGTNVTISASFIPDETHRKIYVIMYFDLNGIKINYPGEHHANACGNIYSYPDKVKVGCPVEKGKRYIFDRSVHIKSQVPKVPRIVVHWAIRDQDTKKDVACFDIIAKVV